MTIRNTETRPARCSGGFFVFPMKGLNMAMAWNETRIGALSDKELLQLRDNAVRKNNAEILTLCELDITRRNLNTKSKRARSVNADRDPLRMMQADIAAEIGEFATALALKYDLSAETAKVQSVGHKRFVPHKLTQSSGTAKLGGLQRAGKCRIDRYVSYRVKDTVLSLNMYLAQDAKDDAVEFHVFGPAAFLPDGQSLDQLRPGLADAIESKLFQWGQRFGKLDEAKTAFEVLVSEVVTAR
jgi:hypothetical protein